MKSDIKGNNREAKLIEGLDFQRMDAHMRWYDQIGRRFYINATKQPLVISFQHNMRGVIEILIEDSNENNGALSEMKGQVIEEE